MLVPPQYIVSLGKDGDKHLVDQNSHGAPGRRSAVARG
jgi:hypothetical protein